MKRVIDILLVEDDNTSQLEVAKALMKRNILHRMTIVKSSEEAIDVLTRARRVRLRKPDVILLDLDIPESNSFEVLATINSNPDWKDIKTFILTASEDAIDKNTALELGASGTVMKPLKLESPSTIDAFNLMIDFMNL